MPAEPSASAPGRAPSSLRTTLLLLMLAVFIAVFGVELVLATRSLSRLSEAAYDRSLAGALKAIDANISTDSGGLAVELPYRMLEFFELTASGPVLFRVATEDRLAEIGTSDLPMPATPLDSGVPVFYDAVYDGRPMRFGAYARPLRRRLYPTPGEVGPQRVVIQVGEVTDSRQAFTRAMLGQVVARDLLVVLLGAGAITVAVLIALRPLVRVRREMAGRADDDLRPVDRDAVPGEVRPLVDALNQHIARHGRLADVQRQFLDDASHQLRTPLAVLRAQIDSARRVDGPARLEVLDAMAQGVDRATRVTGKLLQLARARDAVHGGRRDSFQGCEANALAEDVARALLPLARRRGQDFGFEPAQTPQAIDADPIMLGEALSNLVENAIRHTGEGGQVTVRVAGEAGRVRLGVEDEGPGIPATIRAEAGRRFAGQAGAGGLGLAIAREVATLHGGRLVLEDGPGGRGLSAMLELPLRGGVGATSNLR